MRSVTDLPPGVRRLFSDRGAIDPEDPASRVFITLRLAEEGDREDLRWLLRCLNEIELRRIVARFGPRQLSRRSLEFWRRILDLDTRQDETGSEIWKR